MKSRSSGGSFRGLAGALASAADLPGPLAELPGLFLARTFALGDRAFPLLGEGFRFAMSFSSCLMGLVISL